MSRKFFENVKKVCAYSASLKRVLSDGGACQDYFYEFYSKGSMSFRASWPDLSGEAATPKTAQKQEPARLARRYTILGNYVLALIPALDAYVEPFISSSLGSAPAAKEQYAGFPGKDFEWGYRSSGFLRKSARNISSFQMTERIVDDDLAQMLQFPTCARTSVFAFKSAYSERKTSLSQITLSLVLPFFLIGVSKVSKKSLSIVSTSSKDLPALTLIRLIEPESSLVSELYLKFLK